MMPGLGFELRFEWLNLSIALLAFLVLVPGMIYFERRKKRLPRIRFSSLRNIKPIKPPLKVRLYHLPLWLRITSITLLLIAFAHPYQEKELDRQEQNNDKQEKTLEKKEERKKIEVPSEGISIQLLIDRSGSMGSHPHQN